MTLKKLAESRRLCYCDPRNISYETEYDNEVGLWVKFIRRCEKHGEVDLVQHYYFSMLMDRNI